MGYAKLVHLFCNNKLKQTVKFEHSGKLTVSDELEIDTKKKDHTLSIETEGS